MTFPGPMLPLSAIGCWHTIFKERLLDGSQNDESSFENKRVGKVAFIRQLSNFFGFFIPGEHILSFLRTDLNRSFRSKRRHMARNSMVWMTFSRQLDLLINKTQSILPDARALKNIYESIRRDLTPMKSSCTDNRARQLFTALDSKLEKAIDGCPHQIVARRPHIDAILDNLSKLKSDLSYILEGTGDPAAHWAPLGQLDSNNHPNISDNYAPAIPQNVPVRNDVLTSLPKSFDGNQQLAQDLRNEKTEHSSTKEELRRLHESYDTLLPMYQDNEALLKSARVEIHELTAKIANVESDVRNLRAQVEDQNRQADVYSFTILQLEEASRRFDQLKVDDFLRSAASDLPSTFRAFVEELLRLAAYIEQRSPDTNNNDAEIKDQIERIAEFVYQLPAGKDLIASDRFTPAERVYQVTLLQNRLQHRLEEAGLSLIYPAVGEAFDSSKHLSDDPKIHWFRKGYSHNTIAVVVAVGYSFKGQVLKKALVEKYMRDQTAGTEQENEGSEEASFSSQLESRDDNIERQPLPTGEVTANGENKVLSGEALISSSQAAPIIPISEEAQDGTGSGLETIREEREDMSDHSASEVVLIDEKGDQIQSSAPLVEAYVSFMSANNDDIEQKTSVTDEMAAVVPEQEVSPLEPEKNLIEPEENDQSSTKSPRKRQVPKDAY